MSTSEVLVAARHVTRMCQQFARYHVVSEFGNFALVAAVI
jgi:hypothetical protein